MVKNSRTKNTIINTAAGFTTQLIVLVLSFVSRTIFLKFLSIDYLGINGLYSNILSVLSLAELGIGNVMIFSLYKPVAQDDKETINSLLHFFKKLYLWIAAAVGVFGIALIPFLSYIVKSNLDYGHLVLYYVLFLINSISSYFVVHKTAVINANQQLYIIKRVNLIKTITQLILQIIVLVLFHNYVVYLSIQIVCTILGNVCLSYTADKKYPYIRDKSYIELKQKSVIVENIKSTLIYKIGTTIVNSTDNILISIILGTAVVGYYSNYYMLISSVIAFIGIITTALIPSLGNLNAEENKEKSSGMFFTMILFYHCVAAFGGISFFFLFNDFVPIWIGNKYLLETPVVFAITLNFYLTTMLNPVWMFRETMGLFKQIKYLMLTTAILNLILSIILGKTIGLAGILLSTAVSKIFTIVWYEPKILFGKFRLPVRKYWLKQICLVILTGVSGTMCYFVSMLLGHTLIFIIIKGILFFVITTTVFFIGTYRTYENKWMRGFVVGVVHNLRNKIKT